MSHEKNGASLVDTIQELKEQCSSLEEKIRDHQVAIKNLMDKEDPANNIYFHKEIFEKQQGKIALDVELLHYQNRIKRLTFDLQSTGENKA